jgi:uncharacterized metal-binding protein YceD (DUF177 family)
MTHSPLEKFYDLSALSQAGDEVTLMPDEAQRAALAKFVEVEQVKSFEARIDLQRPQPNRFMLAFAVKADIVQACVVTLDPVESHIEVAFERELKLAHSRQRRAAAPESFDSPAAGQDDGPEDIESPVYDLAGPVLEEFVLAIDPYPRAPGAAFEAPADPIPAADNPFAVLKNLKKQGS